MIFVKKIKRKVTFATGSLVHGNPTPVSVNCFFYIVFGLETVSLNWQPCSYYGFKFGTKFWTLFENPNFWGIRLLLTLKYL